MYPSPRLYLLPHNHYLPPHPRHNLQRRGIGLCHVIKLLLCRHFVSAHEKRIMLMQDVTLEGRNEFPWICVFSGERLNGIKVHTRWNVNFGL